MGNPPSKKIATHYSSDDKTLDGDGITPTNLVLHAASQNNLDAEKYYELFDLATMLPHKFIKRYPESQYLKTNNQTTNIGHSRDQMV